MKGAAAWIAVATVMAMATSKLRHLNLRFESQARGYDQILHKHRKHKRGRQK